MPSLVDIGPAVLEKKMKMWKVYDNNDDDNDGIHLFFSEKLTKAFGSSLPVGGCDGIQHYFVLYPTCKWLHTCNQARIQKIFPEGGFNLK